MKLMSGNNFFQYGKYAIGEVALVCKMEQGEFDQDMVIYFTESEEYRTKVAAHNLLAANNHLQLIRSYKLNAIISLIRLLIVCPLIKMRIPIHK
jgi:hypothetical protein